MSQQKPLKVILDLCLAIHLKAVYIYNTLASHETRTEVITFWANLSTQMDVFVSNWKAIGELAENRNTPASVAEIATHLDTGETIRELEYIDSKILALLNSCNKLRDNPADSFLVAYALATYLIHPAVDNIFRRIVNLPLTTIDRDVAIKHFDDLARGAKEYSDSFIIYDLIRESLQRMWLMNKHAGSQIDVDSSTGAFSKQGLMKAVLPMVNLAQRNKYNIAIMMIGMDDIGDVYSKLGPKKGEKSVQALSKILDKNVRSSDLVGRYDFSTFFVYLSQVNQQFLYTIAQRIVDGTSPTRRMDRSLFVNIGASYGPLQENAEATLDMLINRARDCLIRARMSQNHRILIE